MIAMKKQKNDANGQFLNCIRAQNLEIMKWNYTPVLACWDNSLYQLVFVLLIWNNDNVIFNCLITLGVTSGSNLPSAYAMQASDSTKNLKYLLLIR